MRNGLGKFTGEVLSMKKSLAVTCLLFIFSATSSYASNRTVTLQLPWFHQFQFAGYYAALEQGFYKDAGLNVILREGKPGRTSIDEVNTGRAEYGVSRSEILAERMQGTPVTALASIFQHSAVIFLSKKESGISTPQDMAGRRVMLMEGLNAAEHLAVLANEGMSEEDIVRQSSSYNIDDLINGKTDVFNAYSTNEPFYLQERNIPYTIIQPRDYGINFYGDVLFTSTREVSEHPQQVKAFREASLQGWYYALEHPEEMIDLLISKYEVKKSRKHLQFEAEAIRELIMPKLVEIGHMNPGRWQHMADIFVQLGMAPDSYSLDDFIYAPNPPQDKTWIIKLMVAVALLFVLYAFLMLLFFNYRLKQNLRQRSAELVKTESRFREIFNNMQDGVAIYEPTLDGKDFIFKDLNLSGLTTGQMQKEDVVGKSVKEIFPGVEEFGLLEVFQRVWQTGKPENLPITNYTDDKISHWAENYVCKLPSGEIVAIYADTTQKEIAEEKVRHERNNLRNILNSMDDGVYIVNSQHDIEYLNPTLEREFGPVDGQKCFSYFHDRNEECPWCKNKAVLQGKTVHWQWSSPKNKKTYDLLDTPLINPDGTVSKLEIFHDITEMKIAQEVLLQKSNEWEKTFNAIPNVITLMDTGMRIISANQAAFDLFQMEPEEILGATCYSLFRGATEPCSECPGIASFIDNKKHTRIIEHKSLNKVFQVCSAPILNKNKEVQYFVYIAQDITEKIKLEEELVQAQKMEAIGTLAGGIAHDFNNILMAILGYAEIAKIGLPENSKTTKDINQVITAGNRATELVNQILTFSRKTDQKKSLLRVDLIVSEALKLLRSSLPTTIDIQTDIDKNSGLVFADPTSIHQIVVNLCTNASYAIGNAPGRLEVTLERGNLTPEQLSDKPQIQAGPFVILTVKDTGTGMDKKTVARIFEPYFTTKKHGEGTGLGLAVIHGIVKEYNGFIDVESAPEKGTTFRVHLPAASEDNTLPFDTIEETPPPTGNERILFVDDELEITKIGHSFLTDLGYTVTTETKSPKALELFQEAPESFDLLITDQTMPELTGSELAKAVLKLKPGLPIILCTGYTSAISKDDAYSIGIKRYLSKPFNRRKLAEIVREALDEDSKRPSQ